MSRRIGLAVGLLTLCAGLCAIVPAVAAAPAPEAAKPANLDEAFKQLSAYEFGQSREALTMIADAVRDSHKDPAQRKQLVARLAGVLTANVTLDAKRFACRQLSIAGTAESVPTLAGLLLDKDLSDYARYALERIDAPAAVGAMRTALAKAEGKQKIGLINSLGVRKDAASAAALVAALKDSDAMVASAAAAALGKIGGAEALKALTAAQGTAKPELRAVIDDSVLQCADAVLKAGQKDQAAAIYQDMYKPAEPKHVRMAALRGIVASQGEKALPLLESILSGTDTEMQASALRFLRETSGPDTGKTLAALLPKSPAATQALILDDLAQRGDASVLPGVLALLKSGDAAVRVAAIRAAGKVGDASALPALTELAATGAGTDQEEARRALDRLPGTNVNTAMLALAEKGDAKVRAEVIRSLGVRRVAAAVPVMLKAGEDADAGVRAAALGALDILADEKSAAALAGLVAKAKEDGDRQAAEKALASLCGRAANKDAVVAPILAAMSGAATPAKCALIRALGRAGGAKALAAVRTAVKDPDAAIQDAAIRSLSNWADASAAGDLLEIAKTGAKPNLQILALQGYIRLAAAPGDMSAADRIRMFQEAMAVAKRPEEKRQVLGGLGEVKSPAALKMVMASLKDEALSGEAAIAAVKIAKAIAGSAKDDVRAAMAEVIETTKDNNVKKDAEGAMKQAGGTPKKAATKTLKAPLAAGPAKKVDSSAAESLGWRLGMQAYSFNRLTFEQAAQITGRLGMKYIELFPGQRLSDAKPGVKTEHGMSDADIAEMLKIAQAAGVKIVNYGVVGMGGDEKGNRRVFDFAKKVGIETIVTEAGENDLPGIDKLCQEYGINIALHNHPKPSHYWNAETVLAAVKDRSKRIGSDADTGHWVRSGLVPLDCLKLLAGRIISLHFKDLKGGHDVPWGTGDGNARGMLEELQRQGFRGVFSIEYEYNWISPFEGTWPPPADDKFWRNPQLVELAQCVEFFNATAAELAKKK